MNQDEAFMVRSRCAISEIFAVAVAVVILAAWATVAASAGDGQHGTAVVSAKPERPLLQTKLDAVVAAGAPGVLALVSDGVAGWRNGTNAWLGSSGLADIEAARPMDPSLRFRVGSVTKPFVATVALQLVREHKLSLDDTVEEWLPGSFVRRRCDPPQSPQPHKRHPRLPLPAALRDLLREPVPLVDARGSRRAGIGCCSTLPCRHASVLYSNTDYVLVGMMIERTVHDNLANELERRIFRPLQLDNTSFPFDESEIPAPSSRGYSLALDSRFRPIEGRLYDFTSINPSGSWAAGSITSTVTDLSRFFHGLLKGRLLPPDLLDQMTTTLPGATSGTRYGLGLVEISLRRAGRCSVTTVIFPDSATASLAARMASGRSLW